MKKNTDPKDPALEAVDQVLREISGLESSFLPGDEILEGVVAGDSMVKDLRGLVESSESCRAASSTRYAADNDNLFHAP